MGSMDRRRGLAIAGSLVVIIAMMAATLATSGVLSSNPTQPTTIGGRLVTETAVLELRPSDFIQETFVGSPDRSRAAYALVQGDDRRMLIGDEIGFTYHRISKPSFSFDSSRAAYIAQRLDQTMVVVVDGVESVPYDQLAPAASIFSPDADHVIYAGKRDGSWRLVIDGDETPIPYGEVNALVTGPGGERLALSVEDGVRSRVVERSAGEWIERTAFDIIPGDSIKFSADGSVLAYAGRTDDLWYIITENDVTPPYDSMGRGSPQLSDNGQHVTWRARIGEEWFSFVDGAQFGPYEDSSVPHLSRDGSRFAFEAERDGRSFVVADGVESVGYDQVNQNSISFSPDGSVLAYVAVIGEQAVMVLNGKPQQIYDGIDGNTVTFGPSGELAYAARVGDQWIVVRDGIESVRYDAVGANSLVFSPDGEHLAYAAKHRSRWHVSVDGESSLAYGEVALTGGQGVVFEDAGLIRFLGSRDSTLYAVTEQIGAE